MSDNPTRLVVAAAILDDPTRPRQVLAARRNRPTELAGRWEFPGGKVEPGETPESALIREITEELGVTIDLIDALGEWPIKPSWRLRVWTAALRPGSGSPSPLDGHDRLAWLSPAELGSVAWLDANLPVVAALGDLMKRDQ